MGNEKDKVDPISQSAYQAIKKMILDRQILPGKKINQINMAREINISRTPVVNALHRLEAEGLIDRQMNSGFFVHRLTLQELLDLFDLREIMDMGIVNDLIDTITDEEIASLEEVFTDYKDESHPAESYRKMDMDFHRGLLNLCRNSLIRKMNDNLHILSRSYTAGLIRPREVTMEEHREILAALKSHDRNRAEKAVRDHIGISKDLIKKALESVKNLGLDPSSIHLDEVDLSRLNSKKPTSF